MPLTHKTTEDSGGRCWYYKDRDDCENENADDYICLDWTGGSREIKERIQILIFTTLKNPELYFHNFGAVCGKYELCSADSTQQRANLLTDSHQQNINRFQKNKTSVGFAYTYGVITPDND